MSFSLKVIDKNGPKPKGTGIKQLRENIAESKLSYEIMDDAAQVKGTNSHLSAFSLQLTWFNWNVVISKQAFLKNKIMDNIQKYFYLICFTGYLREQSTIAKDGITEEEKKAFALSGGKGEKTEITFGTHIVFIVPWMKINCFLHIC